MMVITINGKSVDRKNCIKIGNNFYIKNEDVFNINKKWYRKELLHKIKDKYFLKKDLFPVFNYYGDLTDHVEKITSFSVDVYGRLVPISPKDKDFTFLFSTNDYDFYIYYSTITPTSPNRDNRIYNFKELEVINKPILQDKEFLSSFNSILENKTFGFEFETAHGEINNDVLKLFGFNKLYDGSITGNEYVSSIFERDDLINVFNFLKMISTNHYVDYLCSTHIHIGGIPFTEKNAIALYTLFYRLQDEIHELVYNYKKDLSFLAKKREQLDHCKFLKRPISLDYQNIFTHITGFPYTDRAEYKKRYYSNRKWNNPSRYYFVNFNDWILNNGTIELRLLEGTLNPSKVFNWFLLNLSIIEYGIKNTDKIIESKDKIFLSDICNSFPWGKIMENYIIETKHNHFMNFINNDLMVNNKYFNPNYTSSKTCLISQIKK